jgi:hypothetical protein
MLKRVMLRLQKELRTWSNPGAPNPNELEATEDVHRFGGALGMEYVEALRREQRWDRP